MNTLTGRCFKEHVVRGATWRHHHLGAVRLLPLRHRPRVLARANGKDDDDETNPDWDKEMSIFNKRGCACWKPTISPTPRSRTLHMCTITCAELSFPLTV
eukprot:1159566-Pelagomonas_calceolata.AAC.12